MCKCTDKWCDKCTVTLEAVTNNGTINLTNTTGLNNKKVLGMRMRTGTGKTRLGKTLAAQTVIDTAHILVKEQNQVRLDYLPLSTIQRDLRDNEPFCINLQNLDSNSIEIKLDTTAVGYQATHAIEITFYTECC